MLTTGSSTTPDGKARVLQETDIVELIGRSVALKRRGKSFVGLCPFHNEKTPSFHVNPTLQSFRCYGCKKNGNAIDFVIERDRVDFKDALRILAESAGIELPSFGVKHDASERQILLEAHSAACVFYEKLLESSVGNAARDYLLNRGFNAESIKRFRIGLAPDGWDGLLKSPAMRKFTPPQLALAGLAKPREKGDGHYDTFRNRLMFPIRDESGRIIAFGGRVMPGSQDPAKYLNSPETALFSKSRCVYGLDLARPRMIESRTAAVVEGYTDVVIAHQCGASNVVSVLGTALTENHVSILRRFVDRVVLLFDADLAGDTAVDRAIELFLTQPVEIAIATLPDGVDPDEFLIHNGSEAFDRLIAGASDVLTYKWKQLVRRMNEAGDVTGQQKAVQEYLRILGEARGAGNIDPIRWGMALSSVSRMTEIPTPELHRRLKSGAFRKKNSLGPAVQASDGNEPNNNFPTAVLSGRQRAEGFLIGLLLAQPDQWVGIQRHLSPGDFEDPDLRQIADIYWQYQQDEGEPVYNEFVDLLSPPLRLLAAQWVENASALPDTQMALSGCLDHFSDQLRRKKELQLVSRLRQINHSPTEGVDTTGPGEISLATDDRTEIDVLRQLQEMARHPDLKRVKQ